MLRPGQRRGAGADALEEMCRLELERFLEIDLRQPDVARAVLELEPAEKERWLKTCEPIYDQWINDLEKKGLPANKLYAEFKKLLEAQGIKLPR